MKNKMLSAVLFIATCTIGTICHAEGEWSDEVRMQGGVARATAHLYSNGIVSLKTEASSASNWKGVTASVFVIGVDEKGRALYISPNINIPTACGRKDPSSGCSHDVYGTGTDSMDPALAAYITRLDIYISKRDKNFWDINKKKVEDAVALVCKTATDLVPSVKAVICK